MTRDTTALTIDMRTLETVVLRIGLIGLFVACIDASLTMFEQGDYAHELTSVIGGLAVALLGFLCVTVACKTRPNLRWSWLAPVVLVAVFLCHAQIRDVFDHQAGVRSIADIYPLNDYAAALVRFGEQPYSSDMTDAFAVYRGYTASNTATADGGWVDGLWYPALSFVLSTGLQSLGIPTEGYYGLFMVAAALAIVVAAPARWRTVVVLPILIDHRFFVYALGGVNDPIWAFFAVLTVLMWHRRFQRAIWYGLACAAKQQPWFFAPLIAIRIWKETPGDRSARIRAVAEFGLIAFVVFLLPNLPFVLTDFRNWFAVVTGPFFNSAVNLGQGLVGIDAYGWLPIPRTALTALMATVYAIGVVLYWRHFSRLRPWLWILPAIAFWFANRSLSSYFYYFMLPLLAELARDLDRTLNVEARADDQPSLLPSLALVGAGVIAVAAVLVYALVRPPTFEIEVMRPILADGASVQNLRLRVTNQSSREMEPRFGILPQGLQPAVWEIIEGPQSLRPGQTAAYRISTNDPNESFHMARGAVVVVNDRHDLNVRNTVTIDADGGFINPDGIPNGRFEFWDRRGLPILWASGTRGTVRSSDVGLVEAEADGAFDYALRMELTPRSTGEWSSMLLDTWMAMPDMPLTLWINVPEDANHPEALDKVYGIRLFDSSSQQELWVLFGDEAAEGIVDTDTLDDDHDELAPYLIVPAPRGVWTRQTIEPRALFVQAGIAISGPQWTPTRFDVIDYPKQMLNFDLLVATRAEGETADRYTAYFGPLETTSYYADPDDVISLSRQHPEWRLTARGDMLRATYNFAEAVSYYERALSAVPEYAEAHYGIGEAQLAMGDVAGAIASFERALDLGVVRRADVLSALSEAQRSAGDAAAARVSAEDAVDALDDLSFMYRPRQRGRAYQALGWAILTDGSPALALRAFQRATVEDPLDSGAALGTALAAVAADNDDVFAPALRTAIELGAADWAPQTGAAFSRRGMCDQISSWADGFIRAEHESELEAVCSAAGP